MEVRNGSLKVSPPDQIDLDLHQQLLELQGEKKAIFEKSADAIFVIDDASGQIVEVNSNAVTVTGYTVSELRGMKIAHLIPHPATLSKKGEGLTEENNRSRLILERKDGTCIYVDTSTGSVDLVHKSLRLIFITHADRRKSRRFFVAKEPSENDSQESIYEFPNIVGKSPAIRQICQLIGKVAKTDSTVLIHGDSGTGKEIVAQATHVHSLRSKGPFVKVNCAALSDTLLESELFGHVKGAFTGAIRDRRGRFIQADGGTILLDEIGCMSPSGQAKLLRVLEEQKFERVGSSSTTSVDVRIIAATNSDLQKAVAEGTFREDLYYRLNVFSIGLPLLRERKEDVPLLAQHFLTKYNATVCKEIRHIMPETMALMMNYDWPGNVRELKNAVEHAVIVANNSVISPAHLPSTFAMSASVKEDLSLSAEISLRDRLNVLEKQIIEEALARARGVKKQAAAMLQIDPRNLPYLLRKHDLLKKPN